MRAQAISSKKCCAKYKQSNQSLTTSERKKKAVKQLEATRQCVAKWRKPQKEAAAAKTTCTPSQFRSAQTYGKATARARRMMEWALSQTPKRRKVVCKKLYDMELINSTVTLQGEEGI